MNEHLTMEELLTSLKYCMGDLGGDSCTGCPNAVPGSENRDGACKCRVNLQREMIHLLESLTKAE